jgi:hypothetical protein
VVSDQLVQGADELLIDVDPAEAGTAPFVWDHFSEFARTEADTQLLQKFRAGPPKGII